MQVPQFKHTRFMGDVWVNQGQGKGSAFMRLGTLSNHGNDSSFKKHRQKKDFAFFQT